MSDPIRYLELLACAPEPATDPALAAAAAALEPAARQALLAADVAALAAILRAPAPISCIIHIPDNDEPLPERSPDDHDETPVTPDDPDEREPDHD